VLDEPSFRTAARRVQAEMAAHDAANESADLLERLASTRRPVLRRPPDERVLSPSE
jgi:UDP:flavonoid glycosyltransferase YjiC (YdhE family)